MLSVVSRWGPAVSDSGHQGNLQQEMGVEHRDPTLGTGSLRNHGGAFLQCCQTEATGMGLCGGWNSSAGNPTAPDSRVMKSSPTRA